MIIGIGNDMLEMERVSKACEQQAFLTRCFTDKELETFGNKVSSLAGNFCVKEAVVKAFGTGFRKCSLTDIEVLRDELGKPYVNLYGEALKQADELEVKYIHASMSNLKELAMAFVVLESENG